MPTPKDENTQEEEVLPAPMEDTLVCTDSYCKCTLPWEHGSSSVQWWIILWTRFITIFLVVFYVLWMGVWLGPNICDGLSLNTIVSYAFESIVCSLCFFNSYNVPYLVVSEIMMSCLWEGFVVTFNSWNILLPANDWKGSKIWKATN